ncbi:sterol-binding protein [Lysobacter xinjiangensis]|uniref:Ubiquinone biosynthesis accessory factor UbiJ n=1 Tax=Cognatilysobacter xinjiangensis TaxID=546892 RepID=A0ABQ3C6A4_9GAMM|nr:SCP2 sterol-binding domain-containing protein [Lysobacter xinjiangensis]GGZ69576.1 sterol-binding protein [Lysobacter xinjiangensis]
MDERRTPLDSLKPLAGRALEAALNRALALDPDTRDGLRGLDGRRLVLRVATPPLALQIDVDGDRLRVGPVAGEAEPDLSVRATLGGLLAQLPFMRRDDAPAVGKLRIEGDADLARRLQRLAERFDPDWQRPFVAAFGDVLGVQVAQLIRAALSTARNAAGVVATNAADYVQHESQDVVGRDELAAFFDDIDTVRDDVDRLAARVARLSGRRA